MLLGEAAGDTSPLLDAGVGLEAALHASCPAGTPAYARGARTLASALRRDAVLRAALLGGSLSPAALVASPSAALAPPAVRAATAAAEAKSLAGRVLPGAFENGAKTGDHVCPVCGAADALAVRVGGTRDIRKAETWGTAAAEDAPGLRLSCTLCTHEWSAVERGSLG